MTGPFAVTTVRWMPTDPKFDTTQHITKTMADMATGTNEGQKTLDDLTRLLRERCGLANVDNASAPSIAHKLLVQALESGAFATASEIKDSTPSLQHILLARSEGASEDNAWLMKTAARMIDALKRRVERLTTQLLVANGHLIDDRAPAKEA